MKKIIGILLIITGIVLFMSGIIPAYMVLFGSNINPNQSFVAFMFWVLGMFGVALGIYVLEDNL